MKKITFLFALSIFIFLLPESFAVGANRISLSASSVAPRPGEIVNIEAETTPRFDPVRNTLRWEWQGDAVNIRVISEDAISYEAQNAPATFLVTLRDVLKGEDIETATLTVTPISYEIAIRPLTSTDQTTIRLWDNTAKKISEKTGNSARSPVTFEAVIKPQPIGDVRCIWTPGEETALISEDGARATISRSTPGPAVLYLTVTDKKALELGRAEARFDIDFSIEAMEQSVRLDHGQALWENALALRQKGEVEAALIQAEAAERDLAEGGMRDDSLREELAQFRQARDNYLRSLGLATAAASLWRDGRTEDALAKYQEAQALHPQTQTQKSIAELESLLQREKEARAEAAERSREADELAKEGKLAESLEKYEESLKLFSDPAVRLARADVEGRLNALERNISAAEKVRETALALETQGDLENALSKITESLGIHPLPETDADINRIRAALQQQQQQKEKAARLEREGAELESQALEGQGSLEALESVLEKYREADKTWPTLSSEQAIRRTESHMGRIRNNMTQVALLVKEAAQLELEGRLEEAMRRYLRAQDIRRTGDTEKRAADLQRRMDTRAKRMKEAQSLYEKALNLEKQDKLVEALQTARKAENLFSDNTTVFAVKRLQRAVDTRNEKTARAASLADRGQEAWMRGDLEKALDFYIESNTAWHDDEIARTVQTLKGLVSENANTAARAEELFKEAVILERNSSLITAEEKLLSSLTLNETGEARQLLEKVQKNLAEELWAENLKARPLRLRAAPSVPRAGERTVVRIEEGAWTADPNVTWRWETKGNALDGEALDGGRAYGFYPADELPVTVTLTAFKAGTERKLMTQSLSVTAEPYILTLIADEGVKNVKAWNDRLKTLENVREYTTGTDIKIRALIAPLPEGAVSWIWSADPDSVIPASGDSVTTIRRALPGTSKITVTAKDSRGVVLGSAQLNLLITVDKNDVARDARRAEAWTVWLEALSLWKEGKFLLSLEAAERAAVLDPSSSEISGNGTRMREDYGKMERASRLLADGSGLLMAGKTEEAAEKVAEAESLWPDVTAKTLRRDIDVAAEKARDNATLAAMLRAEGVAILARGSKIEALLRFQDSLLLEDNEAVSRDVARLIRETEEQKARLREAVALRGQGNAMADKKHYTEALEFYSRSMSISPDPWLQSYTKILKEKSSEEKVLREKAALLREEGDALMKDKKTAEALGKYKESLQVWNDDKLAKIVNDEEKRIAEEAALKLRKEAEALIKAKKTTEAVAKYRESLKFAHNKEAEEYVKKTEAAEIKKRVEKLTAEGDAFMKQKKPEQALERYRLALTKTPNDAALLEKVRKLEETLKIDDAVPQEDARKSLPGEPSPDQKETAPASEDSRDLVQADALFKEGNALYREKKYRDALQKYKESYRFSQSEKLKEFIGQLEPALENAEKANRLVQEGNDLYKAKSYKEALNKYRESLKYNKNPEVEAFILKVEPLVK